MNFTNRLFASKLVAQVRANEQEIERLRQELLKEQKARKKEAVRAEKAELRVNSLTEAINELKRHNEEILGSTSWMLTAPLRYAVTSALKVSPAVRSLYSRSKRGALLALPKPVEPSSTTSFVASSTSSGPSKPTELFPDSAQHATVVVPVYNAPSAVSACLRSLAATLPKGQPVVVIDDASTDDGVQDVMREHVAAQRLNWRFLKNDENKGYTWTVNRGIRESGASDVILLNADTEVPPLWLQRLRYTAYRQERIASVTAVSDNAGAYSVPEAGQANELPKRLSFVDASRALARSDITPIDVPTGSGFCLYIKRAALNACGAFDDQAFSRGYGEENDWCMRLKTAGWLHQVDFSVYVKHVRSASFGEEKKALIASGRAIVDERYPHYKAEVTRAFGGSAMEERRHRTRVVLGNPSVRPRVLTTVATTTGGTPQTNKDLLYALSDAYEGYVLRCDRRTLYLSQMNGFEWKEVERHDLAAPIDPVSHRSEQYDRILADILHRYGIELVHLRHVGWHSLGAIEMPRQYGLPVLFSFHDYYTVCPSIKLLDDNWNYCAGTCSRGRGQCEVELWPSAEMPPIKNRYVKDWQSQFDSVLRRCNHFITTSEAARTVLVQNYDWLQDADFSTIPHGRNLEFSNQAAEFEHDTPLKILVLGNINEAKGNRVYREIAAKYPDGNFEFHFLGKWRGSAIDDPRFIYHGPYARDALADLVANIRPHAAAILSIWPETWCHTLTEAWSLGLPVFGFNIGAVGDRLQSTGAGWLIEELTAEAVVAAIGAAASDADAWRQKKEVVREVANSREFSPSLRQMADQYAELYRSHLTAEA